MLDVENDVAGRKVTHDDLQAGIVGEFLQLGFP